MGGVLYIQLSPATGPRAHINYLAAASVLRISQVYPKVKGFFLVFGRFFRKISYSGLCLILAKRRGYCLGVGATFLRTITA